MLIKCWCDGSCKPSNPGFAGIGYVIKISKDFTSEEFEIIQGSKFIGQATNNIAELKAIEEVLSILKEKSLENEFVEITTDSQYSIGILVKNWKAKLNKELILKIKDDLNCFSNLTFTWVKGHDGNFYNEMADQLANSAVDENI